MKKIKQVVGVIPAAGRGTRVSPLPVSKELFPVSIDEAVKSASDSSGSYVRVTSSYLVDQLLAAGADKIYWVIGRGKWDIPDYYTKIDAGDNRFGWIVVNETNSVSETIDKAYTFLENQIVLTGFPDIVISPGNAFSILLNKLNKSDADVMLGLFNASDTSSVDMVVLENDIEKEIKEIQSIRVKPDSTQLKYTWLIAAWNPKFTGYLHDTIDGKKHTNAPGRENVTNSELHLGYIINEAVKEGFKVYGHFFKDGSYIDYGNRAGIKRVFSQ